VVGTRDYIPNTQHGIKQQRQFNKFLKGQHGSTDDGDVKLSKNYNMWNYSLCVDAKHIDLANMALNNRDNSINS
jgi:hypothetical protein